MVLWVKRLMPPHRYSILDKERIRDECKHQNSQGTQEVYEKV